MQKEYMLKKNREFRYVCSRGASVSDRYLVLLTVKNRMGLKVGFPVGKKIGNAVKRNHVKCLLRECARRLLPDCPQNYSYLFIARSSSADAGYAQLYASMSRLLAKSAEQKQK